MKKAAKIKSKAYHRILKKEKQRKQSELSLEQLEELDPELAAKERMKLETERARVCINCYYFNIFISISTFKSVLYMKYY